MKESTPVPPPLPAVIDFGCGVERAGRPGKAGHIMIRLAGALQ
jgi:hypothetical protein